MVTTGDGGVRLLSNTIDENVHRALHSRDGGEAVSDQNF
jgi:hypothetical protein